MQRNNQNTPAGRFISEYRRQNEAKTKPQQEINPPLLRFAAGFAQRCFSKSIESICWAVEKTPGRKAPLYIFSQGNTNKPAAWPADCLDNALVVKPRNRSNRHEKHPFSIKIS
ncbi:MAG TPA: hypothetical protein IAA58_04365 [Candidatus Gallacutalibacter stercoravium]|nr:hypothetical protein [Candidatus Gallacutalibacter stercoravium]